MIRLVPLTDLGGGFTKFPQTSLINATAAITSQAFQQTRLLGDAIGLYIVLAGGGPSVDVTMTVSKDDAGTFIVPYDTAGNSLGDIMTTLTATRWIQFTPVMAPYFKITITGDGDNGADTTCAAYMIVQEDV